MYRSILLTASVAFSSVAISSCILNANSQPRQSNHDADYYIPPPETGASNYVNWKMMTDNTWTHDANKEVYVYVELKTDKARQDQKRVPLNISLVLDRSGSMQGAKIAYAKRAAKFVIDQLDNEDYVSIVNYDDKIEVSSPSQRVRNKELLKKHIDKLTDRGSTNLTGGMLEGYNQVQSTWKNGYVNRVLLLTDGLANVGITDPKQMKKLVDKKYNDQNVALSTFGLGADYNEDLLTILAEMGRANYYYIDKADKIPDIFDRELKGLLSVVAQNAIVSINVPDGLSCEKVYGYPYEVKNGKLHVRFNDLYANDEKGLLIRFRKNKRDISSYTFNGTLSYTETKDFTKIEERRNVSVSLTSDQRLVARSKNRKVCEMIALFESTERFDEIMEQVDKGNYRAAKEMAESEVVKLKSTQADVSSEKLKAREVQITNYASSMDSISKMRTVEKSMYQKSNKEVNYKARKMK